MVQEVKDLPSKCEALSLNPRMDKRKKAKNNHEILVLTFQTKQNLTTQIKAVEKKRKNKTKLRLATVAHIRNPTWEAEIRRIEI
jgi:hypothetical protein